MQDFWESAKQNATCAAVTSATRGWEMLIQYETLPLAKEKGLCEVLHTAKCCQEWWAVSEYSLVGCQGCLIQI